MPFMNVLRCACVHARVFVLACEELHTYACNSVSKNEPPLVKADYGPDDYTDAPYLWSMFGW